MDGERRCGVTEVVRSDRQAQSSRSRIEAVASNCGSARLEREHDRLARAGQATNALHPIDGLDDGLALQHVQGGDRILKMSQLGAA